jgi:hypothetical protein
MHRLFPILICSLLLVQSGCGSTTPADKLAQELVATFNQEAEQISTVTSLHQA